MRDDAILQRVDGHQFRLLEWDGGIAFRGDARAVGISWRGVFTKCPLYSYTYRWALHALRLSVPGSGMGRQSDLQVAFGVF
jgi:hypothetical protein